jgi:putative holliday junction resolvase
MIIGIDYGARRVGIAVSSSGVLATPHSVLRNEAGLDDLIERLAAFADEVEATEFVLGVPAGSRHDRESIIQSFEAIAERLRQRTCKPVTLWDESYSTHEASERRRDAGKSWKSAKKEIDREAAAIILQSFLDARAGGRP